MSEIRTGKCNPKMCGAVCCRIGPHLLVRTAGEASKEYPLYDFFRWAVINFPGKKGISIAYPDQKCKHLRGLKCSIHKKKPIHCKVWPNSRDNWYRLARMNGCTYRFKKKEVKS